MNYLHLLYIPIILVHSWSDLSHQPSKESNQTDERHTVMNKDLSAPASSYTYLALGDSYTIGEGVEEAKRWPIQLQSKMSEIGLDITKTDIIARTGWTTDDLLKAIEQEKPKKHDLVSLLIGVNNQYQKLPFDLFKKEFDELLEISVQLAINKQGVFVVSIPDYGYTPFGSKDRKKIGKEIDQYNNYIKQRCDLMKIPFIDITAISRSLGDSDKALAEDKLHPSGYQYSLWKDQIYLSVADILQK